MRSTWRRVPNGRPARPAKAAYRLINQMVPDCPGVGVPPGESGKGVLVALRKEIRILVVDDMSVSRQILLQMLEVIGIRDLRAASGGCLAFEALVQEPADLVIADLNMPGLSGLELLAKLRADRRFCRIGYVMTSGQDTDERIEMAWKMGLDRFLSKPFDIKRLVSCLEATAGRV